MIDLKLVQRQPEVLAKALADRHSDISVDAFLELDGKRSTLLTEVEGLKSKRNEASGQVAALKRSGQDAGELLAELSTLSDRIKELDVETAQAKADVESWLMRVPNIPDSTVPLGANEDENVEVNRWGTPRQFDFDVREHGDIGVALGGLDFERAARLTGSRFVVSLGWGARLERALAAFFLDRHTCHGDYIEVSPPYMVNRATMTGTAQLPKFEEDLFKLQDWDYFLIPTAEVPLTNLHAGEVLDEADLPRAYCAATPCFRSEAGSAGKDTRGIIRMHSSPRLKWFASLIPKTASTTLNSCAVTPVNCWNCWNCPTASSPCALAIWAFLLPKPTTLKCGCPRRKPTGKYRPAPTAPTFRRAGQTSASSPRVARRLLSTPSTVPACPLAAPPPPYWKIASKGTAA